jgi:hypothetical protein
MPKAKKCIGAPGCYTPHTWKNKNNSKKGLKNQTFLKSKMNTGIVLMKIFH